MAAPSSATARRYGSGAGLLAGVSSAATIAVKRVASARRARARGRSPRRSAPEAIAIGTAAAARRIAPRPRRETAPTPRARAPRAGRPCGRPARRSRSTFHAHAVVGADRAKRADVVVARDSGRSSRPRSARCPSSASTSRNARKCSGSLLAMTPSKSKTMARSATYRFRSSASRRRGSGASAGSPPAGTDSRRSGCSSSTG